MGYGTPLPNVHKMPKSILLLLLLLLLLYLWPLYDTMNVQNTLNAVQ